MTDLPRRWTPLHLEILLWAHTRAEPLQVPDTETCRVYVGDLERFELIKRSGGHLSPYKTTRRGAAHVEALCRLPLPQPVTRYESRFSGDLLAGEHGKD